MLNYLWCLLGACTMISCAEHKNQTTTNMIEANYASTESGYDTATFGTGCFWCTEAIFQRLKGVEKVVSGYTGGFVNNPTYEEVCKGTTGHAEACQILYNPDVISYDELLSVFWKTHDPTTLNRQGNDIGTQYRSAIFYHNAEQKAKAEYYLKKLDSSHAYDAPIVTTIEPYKIFFPAEAYHQNYYNKNGNQMYCRYVIQPKLEKFEQVFKDKLKPANTGIASEH
ncbi:MAG: peptide-methionine (S)-S-oxide reductase MsrA [Bacteroidetes bacterium]|nr:peptide-methionine (S)-S-oxide reductase MsrA [Bacteroidota bacterium]